MVVESGYGAAEEGCRTPRRGGGCEIPATLVCPPAPRKKRVKMINNGKKQRPKNGYFQSPDLEIFFAMAPRREPYCA